MMTTNNPSRGSIGAFPELPVPVPIPSSQVFAPLRRNLTLIVAVALIGGAISTAIRLYLGTEYRASTAVMVINSPESGKLPMGIAGALLNATQTGLEPSPALLTEFAQFPSILNKIAETRGPEPRTKTVLEQLEPALVNERGKWADEVARHLDVALEQRTGVVKISMDHRDSALSRFVVQTAVRTLGTAFMDAAKGQATGQRIANEARAENAREQLRLAEQRLAAFTAANRGITQYARANVTLQGLDRDVQLAQNLYMQAATDMEEARSKELQQTPAVMVVDELPAHLPKVPRRLWFWLPFGMFLGLVLIVPWILWRANRHGHEDVFSATHT